MIMQNETYARILSTLSTGISVLEAIRSDGHITDFRWLYVNEATQKITGSALEDLKSTTLFQKYPELKPSLPVLTDVVENGTISEREVYHPDMDKWIVFKAKKYQDGYLTTLQDVTAKKSAENKAATNERLFSALFQNSGVGIGVVDAKGCFIRANDKMGLMFQYTAKEIEGKNLHEFYYQHDEDNGYAKYLQLLNKECTSYEMEKRYVRRDGTVFWGLLSVSLLELPGMENAAIGILQEIDAIKNTEEALRVKNNELLELNSYKDKLLAITAHDLKGPFSTFKNFLELIIQEYDTLTKEELLSNLNDIHKQTVHIYDLLEELLVWAQSVLNKHDYIPAELDLNAELERKIKRFTPMCVEKHIDIRIKGNEHFTIKADASMLRAVLRNLMSNAVKYSPRNSAITIETARAADNMVIISFADQGAGINEDTKQRILDGKGVESAYGTGGEKGVGLGLSVCKDFIEKNKGRFFIDNNSGKGCKFSFTVPQI